MTNRSIAFFESQFCTQAQQQNYALNPFELMALPHLSGRVLDLGCGLGNLSVEAARHGCVVHALDAAPAGVEDLRRRAQSLALPITAELADLAQYRIKETYDCIVSIGLLMFFPPHLAKERLGEIRTAVTPGGIAVINTLIEGTTYLDMFEPNHYYLFREPELEQYFKDWEIVESKIDLFPAPGATVKRFSTVIARRPRA
ncbi:MAG: class I SAM-dependent methyltransferase [Burkholderiales bacterium]|nr:class I SAM-dependent methyltransferase [Burkholderiales bacterium]